MAAYEYMSAIVFDPLSGLISFSVSFTGSLIESMGSDNGIMEFGESWANNNFTFVGTLSVNGGEFPVLKSNDVPTSFVAYFPALGSEGFTDGESVDLADITIETLMICFASGTMLATPRGGQAVERLTIGDVIVTADGHSVPVKWIGRQTVSTRFGPAERLQPVRVRAGALGDGLPLRDLTLTADHALLIDGLLINAGALVNGDSIDYVPLSELGETYTVYHIETEAHDVILAEGTPAETYIDYIARRAFDNYAEYLELYGEDRTIPEMAYPRISSARMLPEALKAKLVRPHAA